MKQKLETAANVAVIVVGLMLTFLFVKDYLPSRRTTAGDANPIKAGTRLVVKGVRWDTSERTLVLALRVGCEFCMQSVPFYGRLDQMRKSGKIQARIIAVLPNDPQSTQAMLKAARLSFPAVSRINLGSLGVPGTPTAIVVDGEGRVLKSWLGVLSPSAQKDLIATLSAARFNVLRLRTRPIG